MAVDIKQMTNLRLKINQLENEKKERKDDIELVELLDKLIKKYSGIKPADIKNKLMVVAFLKNVKN